MRGTTERLDKLVRMPRNPKSHDLGALHQSYDRFGFLDRVVINEVTGHILAGHGRVNALQQRKVRGFAPPDNIETAPDGMWLVPVDWVTVSKEAEEAALLALNRIGEGQWDEPELVEVLADLAAGEGLDGTGFDVDDLDDMLAQLSALGLDAIDATEEEGLTREIGRLISIEVTQETYETWQAWVARVAVGKQQVAFEKALDFALQWYERQSEA